jgi:hypothetical protein
LVTDMATRPNRDGIQFSIKLLVSSTGCITSCFRMREPKDVADWLCCMGCQGRSARHRILALRSTELPTFSGSIWKLGHPHFGKWSGPTNGYHSPSSDARSHQRHHLNLYAASQSAEAERLLLIGAARVEWRYTERADYVVLADLDGNTFCLIKKGE